MKNFTFLVYFLKLRFLVAFGMHKTANPLDWNWRMRHWHGTTDMRGVRGQKKSVPSETD